MCKNHSKKNLAISTRKQVWVAAKAIFYGPICDLWSPSVNILNGLIWSCHGSLKNCTRRKTYFRLMKLRIYMRTCICVLFLGHSTLFSFHYELMTCASVGLCAEKLNRRLRKHLGRERSVNMICHHESISNLRRGPKILGESWFRTIYKQAGCPGFARGPEVIF